MTDIPGLDVAGTVVAVGAGVRRWRAGDAVCALVAGGGYAEYCTVPEPQSLPVPAGLDFVQAAALPETFFTVWSNVFQDAGLAAGERILVHGGASGIGTAAIQLAAAFGAEVYAAAGSVDKCDACRRLGAILAVNRHEHDFAEAVLDATGGEGVDVILDVAGAEVLERNVRLLRLGGRLVFLSFLSGSRAVLDLLPILRKHLVLTGSALRPRTVAEKGAIADDLEAQVWPLLASGRIAPVVDSTFPLERAAEAHARLESGAHIGKIVLTVAKPTA